MSVSRTIILSPRERLCLQRLARSQKSPHSLVLRAKIILLASSGTSHSEIARQLCINRTTVLHWLDRWVESAPKLAAAQSKAVEEHLLHEMIEQSLRDLPRSGAPPHFTAEQICQIIAVACENPEESGRPISHWTPRELADEVIKRGIAESISVRSVGRFLKSGGVEAASGRVLAECQAR